MIINIFSDRNMVNMYLTTLERISKDNPLGVENKLRFRLKFFANLYVGHQEITGTDFIYHHALYLKPIYDYFKLPYDEKFIECSKGNFNYNGIKNSNLMTFHQFKKKRQKENPKIKGQGLQKGELSHKEAYEQYLIENGGK